MKTSRKAATTVLAGALLFCASARDAHASGILLDESALSARSRATLHAQVSQARLSEPESFRAVAELIARVPALDAKSRSGHAPIALYLKPLGAKAVLPMLELLTFDPPSGIAPDGLAAAKLDLVEAVGLQRDARAMPVLAAILDKSADYATARTAAEAIARLESDDAVTHLTSALAAAQGDRARGILAGMGACHREAIAKALAGQISTSAAPTAIAVARSLGNVGNAWAWKTLTNRAEETATRAASAKALVTMFAHGSAETRQAASNALMVVDDPSTPALADGARSGASPETLAALDDLVRRFASNPARTH